MTLDLFEYDEQQRRDWERRNDEMRQGPVLRPWLRGVPPTEEAMANTKLTLIIEEDKLCDECCDAKAVFKHTFLLEGVRNNPASSAYCKDDCSWCSDLDFFTCAECKPETPDGYVGNARFENSERFAHMFRKRKQVASGLPESAVCFFHAGDKWCCVNADFININESPCGFGDTFDEALDALQKQLVGGEAGMPS